LKKLLAIAMLMLLIFNMGGYQLLFQYFIYQSDNFITEQINNNRYKSTDLIEVKIPVHLTISDWDAFQPIGGQLKVKDKVYNYAELRLTRDTMYLMCIPNHEKARIINAKNVYAKQVNDIPVNKKSNLPLLKKNISENYYTHTDNKFGILTPTERTKNWRNYVTSNIISTSINFAGQPPDAGIIFVS
jgi:hypothetical protein